jgi:outer membrane protein TolC
MSNYLNYFLVLPALAMTVATPMASQEAQQSTHSEPSMTLEAAIRQAWTGQPGLQAGEAMVDRARSEADAMRELNLPTVSLSVGLMRTDQPMMAFGMKLNQARITQMDFNPASLNKPEAIMGIGGGLTLSQPLYTGGRLTAARKAGGAMADAEVANQSHRRQQVALAVVQAYFGAQVAEQGKVYAEDSLRQAREVERFVQARVDQGLMLQAEGMRIRAYRAQAEAGLVEARQRVASARSGLALLTGKEAAPVTLATSLKAESNPATEGTLGTRGDLQAAKFQWQAAQQGAKAAQGSLLPEVGLNLGPGPMDNTWSSGGNWSEVSLGFKWNIFSGPDRRRVSSAKAMERAASYNLRWQEQVAGREVSEARLAMESASARIKMAQEAVEASESVRTLRQARHREGLLPLTEVLDAEAGLSGARTLLLNSQYELRVSRAQLSLAQGQPIEGVQ